MAQSLQIAKMSAKHEAVLRWLLTNVDEPLSKCAEKFGYSQNHLSVIIHSDAFQSRLREAQDAMTSDLTISIKDKATALAHESMDRLGKLIPVANDIEAVVDVAELALATLGYGPKAKAPQAPTGVNINMQFGGQITPEELSRARATAVAIREGDAVREGDAHILPAPEKP